MNRIKLLQAMEKHADYTVEDLAKVLDESSITIDEEIKQLITDKIVLGKHTVINWDKYSTERCLAFIEVGVTPQRDFGYDKIAARIYNYEEVTDCYLMSGTFDLIVIVEGKTMQEIARFVATKLATVENVKSTATYFVLKTYKHYSVVFEDNTNKQERVEIS